MAFINTLKGYLKNLFIPHKGNNHKPRLLAGNFFVYAIIAVAVLKILSVALVLPIGENYFYADITKIDLQNLLNQDREKAGLQTLRENPKLDQAALLKAQDMVQNNYFAHQSPTGITPWYWFKEAGYPYQYAGENLAIGFADSANVYQAWYNSPSHKENLFDPRYTDVGTAVLGGFGGNQNTVVVVQLFGTPLPVTLTTVNPTVKPTPKPVTVAQVSKVKPIPANQPSVVITNPVQATTEEKVLAETSTYSFQVPKNVSSNFNIKLMNLIVYGSKEFFSVAIYGLLLCVGVCLLLSLSFNLFAQRPVFILKAAVLMIVLSSLLFLSPDAVLHVGGGSILI